MKIELFLIISFSKLRERIFLYANMFVIMPILGLGYHSEWGKCTA
jgi:hypothetical protein